MARILLVEDDADQREIRRLILMRAGHTVLAECSCDGALASLAEAAPDCVITDLRLPEKEDGLKLLRTLRRQSPGVPVVVLSGWPEDLKDMAQEERPSTVLAKPLRSATLLKTITRLVGALLLVFLLGGAARAAGRDFEFNVKQDGEVLAELRLLAPGADWAVAGREGALAELWVDGDTTRQHLWAFGFAVTRRVFLGRLSAGKHTLHVERNQCYSAAGAGLEVQSATFSPGDGEIVRNAPIVLARTNTVGLFTDVPLLAYATRGHDNAGRYLEYTVIFSNEDGGTSTRDLMSRWGRTTDIEYIYRIWPDAAGNARQTLIQTREHQDVPYAGIRVGSHPVLMPVTDNNMVEPAALDAVPIRCQLAPLEFDLGGGSRELVMDAAPWSYRIASEELRREDKLRPYGRFEGEKISDPRNYLVVELKSTNRNAAVQALVRLRAGGAWKGSANGLGKSFIERSGWARSTIELPPGTRREDIAGLGAQCLSLRDLVKQPVPKTGHCTIEAFGKVFFLGSDYTPGAALPLPALPAGGWALDAGDLMTLEPR